MSLKTLSFALLSGLALFACGGGSTPTPLAPHADSSNADKSAFPWPKPLPSTQDPDCVEAEKRVRSGLALAVDVDLAAECVADRISPEQYAAFRPQLADYYRTAPFLAVAPSCLGPKSQPVGAPETVDKVLALVSPEAESNNCQETQLDSGTKWRGICLPGTSKGHFDATLEVVEAMGTTFSAKAQAILADASQDPDVFEWTNMSAHGQTPDKDGMPATANGEADLVNWFRGRIQLAAAACQSPSDPNMTKQALYWTGYALHALEDLAPHRGRTNPEHSYNAAHGENPDAAGDAYKLAVDIVNQALKRLLDGPLQSCKPQFATYSGPQVSYKEKLAPPYSLKRDFTAKSLVDYKRSAAAFEKVKDKPGAVIRWFGPLGPPSPTCTDEKCTKLLTRLTSLSDP